MDASSLLDLRTILFTLVILLIAGYLKKLQESYKFFEKLGLKNPPFTFFFGNFFQIYQRTPDALKEWTQKYGKTYGFFEGHFPILVTSDIEIVNEVLVKQFNNFTARRPRPLDQPDEAPRVSLITAIDTKWKNMRNILNPAFSTLKIREMNPMFEDKLNLLMNIIKKESQKKDYNTKMIVKAFTMDSLWSCVFGLEADLQNDLNNIYFQKTEDTVKRLVDYHFLMFPPMFFPEIRKYLVIVYYMIQLTLFKYQRFPFLSRFLESLIWLRETSINIVNKRIESNITKRDFLSLLIEAYTNNLDEMQKIEKYDAETTKLKKKLSIEEIKTNLGVILVAGNDTISTTLCYCLHTLAKYPEEQAKLIAEVDENYPLDSDAKPNTDNVKNLKYMRCFVDEVLRLYPVAANVVNRRCIHPTTIKGIPITKGMAIQIDTLSVHKDPELWGPVDPETFYPERFLEENKRHPLAFLAFGGGSRNCIGMKFAYIEMFMFLATLLRKYEIHKSDNFKDELTYRDGFIRLLNGPLDIRFVERKL